MVPRASDRTTDQQAASQRRSMMCAHRTDGKQFAGLVHEQGRLTTDMTDHYVAFNDICQRNALSKIGSGW
jgi:hypothetical protein